MSYCRRSDESDVYMVGTKDHLECLACEFFKKRYSPTFKRRSIAIFHLARHKAAGHKVLKGAVDRLWKEIEEVGDDY